jgi:hypothetical protein
MASKETTTVSKAGDDLVSKSGDDLVAALAAYDNANPKSAEDNKCYWNSIASNPSTKSQAASAACVISGRKTPTVLPSMSSGMK